MIAAPESETLAPAGGEWRVGGDTVWWRVGSVTPSTDSGSVARDWVEQIVRETGVFRWQGFAPTSARGKPRFAAVTDADFNVSHSGDSVLVAVSRRSRIGVDIEKAPFAAFDSVALRRRMLTPAEQSTAAHYSGVDRTRYLARVWTAKEALVKASGDGLARDFRRFTVPVLSAARTQPAEACLVALTSARRPQFLRLTLSPAARPEETN